MYSAIRLQPGMDNDTLVSRLNENFVMLEVETDIYKIADSYTWPAVSVGAGVATSQTKTIEHNMNIIPKFELYGSLFNDTSLGMSGYFPQETVTLLTDGFTTSPNSYGNDIQYTYRIGADTENIYVARICFNTAGSSKTTSADKLYYYVNRQSATQ